MTKSLVYVYELDLELQIYCMFENFDKILHFRIHFDACLMNAPCLIVHLTHNISARVHYYFVTILLQKENRSLLIYMMFRFLIHNTNEIWRKRFVFYFFIFHTLEFESGTFPSSFDVNVSFGKNIFGKIIS